MSANAPKFADAEVKATRQKIGSAGLALIARAPHFGLAWAKMRPIARVPSETQAGTWEVDRAGVLYADPAWTAKLNEHEAQFVLAHEIMHVLSGHQQRSVSLGLRRPDGYTVPGQEQNLKVWGIAADMAINHALKADSIGSMPKCGVLPPAEYIDAKFRLDAESIYFWLLKQLQSAPQGGQGRRGQSASAAQVAQLVAEAGDNPQPTAGCQPKPAPGDGEGQGDGQSNAGAAPGAPKAGAGGQGQPKPAPIDWNDVRASVEACARQIGGQFAGQGSAVANLLAPAPTKMDWRRLCRQGAETVSATAEERDRRTYSRIARRPELVAGILRPGHVGTEGTLGVACDVSGSIDRAMVAKIAGHMQRICSQFPNVRVIFVTHTDRVEYSAVLKPGGDLAKVLEGLRHTGGTRAAPAYARTLELNKGKKVDTFIHFTDGYIESRWPDPPGKKFVIGLCGGGQGGTKHPEGARVVPVEG